MNGFLGGCYEKCYTDIRVFNPLTVDPTSNPILRSMKPLKRRLMSLASVK